MKGFGGWVGEVLYQSASCSSSYLMFLHGSTYQTPPFFFFFWLEMQSSASFFRCLNYRKWKIQCTRKIPWKQGKDMKSKTAPHGWLTKGEAVQCPQLDFNDKKITTKTTVKRKPPLLSHWLPVYNLTMGRSSNEGGVISRKDLDAMCQVM